jgi:hypothetical protein
MAVCHTGCFGEGRAEKSGLFCKKRVEAEVIPEDRL